MVVTLDNVWNEPYRSAKETITVPRPYIPSLVGTAIRQHFPNSVPTYDRSLNIIQGRIDGRQHWDNQPFSESFDYIVGWQVTSNMVPPIVTEDQEIELEQVEIEVRVRKVDPNSDRITVNKKCLERCNKIATTIFTASGSLLAELRVRPRNTAHGSASWATAACLESENYISTVPLSPEERSVRYLLGYLRDKEVSVPERVTHAHVLICGPSGTGKTTTQIIPNLIERAKVSALVTEVASHDDYPPVFSMTEGFRRHAGHETFYFNPSDPKSDRINPIDFVHGLSDAWMLSNLLIANTMAKFHAGDQIWVQTETRLLNSLILHAASLREAGQPNNATLGYVRSLFSLGVSGMEEVLRESPSRDARSQFIEFKNNSSENFRFGVLSGLASRLDAWLIPQICELTKQTDIDLQALIDNYFTIYLAASESSPEFKPVSALVLRALVNFIRNKKSSLRTPVTLFLDEFAAFGRIPHFHNTIATMRNSRIGVVLGFQTIDQLYLNYSREEAAVLFACTDTKIVFATNAPEGRVFSNLLGDTTVVDLDVSDRLSLTERARRAPLLSTSDLASLPKEYDADGTPIATQCIVIRNGRLPIKLKTSRFDRYTREANRFPPAERKPKAVSDRIRRECEDARTGHEDLDRGQAIIQEIETKRQQLKSVSEAGDGAAAAELQQQLADTRPHGAVFNSQEPEAEAISENVMQTAKIVFQNLKAATEAQHSTGPYGNESVKRSSSDANDVDYDR